MDEQEIIRDAEKTILRVLKKTGIQNRSKWETV
jgi:hypothetical protein